jgi:hypothetical protein
MKETGIAFFSIEVSQDKGAEEIRWPALST